MMPLTKYQNDLEEEHSYGSIAAPQCDHENKPAMSSSLLGMMAAGATISAPMKKESNAPSSHCGPSFHPIESDLFKDFTLMEILKLSDDFVFDTAASTSDYNHSSALHGLLQPEDSTYHSSCTLNSPENEPISLNFFSPPHCCEDKRANGWPEDTPSICLSVMPLLESSLDKEVVDYSADKSLFEEELSKNNESMSTKVACISSDLAESLNKKRNRASDEQEKDSPAPEESQAFPKSDSRFRPYQEEQWAEHFQALCEYRNREGNCLVPHLYPQNPALARWVKRQRYSYKVKVAGQKASSMTPERIAALEGIGFVWDSQSAAWEERFCELSEFRQATGHCRVPANYRLNPKLARWVKCQRRQYKAYVDGEHSTLTNERIFNLESIGFEWLIRPSFVNKEKSRSSDRPKKMARIH